MVKGLFAALQSGTFALLLTVALFGGPSGLFLAAEAKPVTVCSQSLIAASDPSETGEYQARTEASRNLIRAKDYLAEVVQKQQPFTFENAIEYVLLSLPEGKEKESFIDSLQRNIIQNDLTLKERKGLRGILGSNRVGYASRLLHPLKDQRDLSQKIYWKSRIVKNSEEALYQVFDAIRIVLEPEFKPIRSATVYFSQRSNYVKDFIESAQKLFTIEYEVYRSTQQFADVSMPAPSPLGGAFAKVKRTFRNLLWLKQYRTIRDLKLSEDVVQAIEAQDPLALKTLIRKKYGAELLVEWYTRHLANVRNASIMALAALLVPPLTGAVVHQQALETLQSSQIDVSTLKNAEQLVSGANAETLELLQRGLQSTPQGGLQSSEAEFFGEIQGLLARDQEGAEGEAASETELPR